MCSKQRELEMQKNEIVIYISHRILWCYDLIFISFDPKKDLNFYNFATS
jgi:hypothetical protein